MARRCVQHLENRPIRSTARGRKRAALCGTFCIENKDGVLQYILYGNGNIATVAVTPDRAKPAGNMMGARHANVYFAWTGGEVHAADNTHIPSGSRQAPAFPLALPTNELTRISRDLRL
jgi:hypothetical protein